MLSPAPALPAIVRVIIMLSKAVIIVLIFPFGVKGLFLKQCHSYDVRVNNTGRDFKRYLALGTIIKSILNFRLYSIVGKTINMEIRNCGFLSVYA